MPLENDAVGTGMCIVVCSFSSVPAAVQRTVSTADTQAMLAMNIVQGMLIVVESILRLLLLFFLERVKALDRQERACLGQRFSYAHFCHIGAIQDLHAQLSL